MFLHIFGNVICMGKPLWQLKHAQTQRPDLTRQDDAQFMSIQPARNLHGLRDSSYGNRGPVGEEDVCCHMVGESMVLVSHNQHYAIASVIQSFWETLEDNLKFMFLPKRSSTLAIGDC